jgi:hypothetical protein
MAVAAGFGGLLGFSRPCLVCRQEKLLEPGDEQLPLMRLERGEDGVVDFPGQRPRSLQDGLPERSDRDGPRSPVG